VDSGDTSIHPTAVAAGRDRADARLEQLRVNGRREHGNVMRKTCKENEKQERVI